MKSGKADAIVAGDNYGNKKGRSCMGYSNSKMQ